MLTLRIQRPLAWFGGFALVGLIGLHCVAPALVERALRDKLETSGFTEATFDVESVGIDDLRIADVRIGSGIQLGELAVDGGLSLLWRDPSSTVVTIRDARVTPEALRELPSSGAPFGRLVLERAELALAGGRVVVSGTVDLRTQAVDLVARVASWRVGKLSLRDVVATARGDGTRTDVCVKGRVETATLIACAAVPPSLAALEKLRAADVTWRITGREWHGRGTGTLAWPRGELALDLTGEARARTLELRGVTLHGLAVPVALRASSAGVRATKPLVATADRATIDVAGATAVVTCPELTIARTGELVTWPRPMTWTAADAAWRGIRVASLSGTIGDVNTIDSAPPSAVLRAPPEVELAIAWRAITGLGPIDAGAGQVGLRVGDGRVAVASVRVALAGGIVSAAPFVVGGRAPVDVSLRIERVALGRILGRLGRGRLEGTGALDGEVAIRLDGGDVTVVNAALRSRGRGTIRSSDAAWRAKMAAAASSNAPQRRLLGALSELEYDHLRATLGPRDAQVVLRARGKQVPQALDLVINLHGVRDAFSHLARVARELE